MSPERRTPYHYHLKDVLRFAKETTLKHGGHVPALIAEGSRGAAIMELTALPDTHEECLQYFFSNGMTLAQAK